LDGLVKLEETPLLARNDYGQALTAAETSLGKVRQFEAEIEEISELGTKLNSLLAKINEPGKRALAPQSRAKLADVSDTIKMLKTANVPLTPNARGRLDTATADLAQLEDALQEALGRDTIVKSSQVNTPSDGRQRGCTFLSSCESNNELDCAAGA